MTDKRLHRADGSQIAWQCEGSPAAPVVILSNSLAADRSMWQPMVDDLVKQYRLITYDTRGHGASSSGRSTATLTDLADDLVAVLDAAGAKRAVIVGISLGGMTAMTAALLHPDRVAGVLACNCRATIDAAGVDAWGQRLALARSEGMGALADPTVQRWFTPAFFAANPVLMARVRQMIADTSLPGYEACVSAISGLDLIDGIGAIGVPTGFVAGAQDGAAPVADMQAMADRVAGARLTVLDPCGHLSSLEQPEALAAEVARIVAASQAPAKRDPA